MSTPENPYTPRTPRESSSDARDPVAGGTNESAAHNAPDESSRDWASLGDSAHNDTPPDQSEQTHIALPQGSYLPPGYGAPGPSDQSGDNPYGGIPTAATTSGNQYGSNQYSTSQYGSNPYSTNQYQGPGVYAPAVSPQGYNPYANRTNTLAIISLVASLISLFCGLSSVAGIICGIVSLNQIKSTKEQGRGLAIAGIVISSVVVALFVVLIILWFSLAMSTMSGTSVDTYTTTY